MVCDLAGTSNDNPGRGDAAWHERCSNDAGPIYGTRSAICSTCVICSETETDLASRNLSQPTTVLGPLQPRQLKPPLGFSIPSGFRSFQVLPSCIPNAKVCGQRKVTQCGFRASPPLLGYVGTTNTRT